MEKSFFEVPHLKNSSDPVPARGHVVIVWCTILNFHKMFACAEPNLLGSSISVIDIVTTYCSKIPVFSTIQNDTSTKVIACTSHSHDIVFDGDELSELQLELDSHIWKLRPVVSWRKNIVIPHICLLLHPGQQVA